MAQILLGALAVIQAACWSARSSQPGDHAPVPAPGDEVLRGRTASARGCPLRILDMHHATRDASGRLLGHNGVDFAVCSGGHVIAIGEGIVGHVGTTDINPEGEGGLLFIEHFDSKEPPVLTPLGYGRIVHTYVYGQISN